MQQFKLINFGRTKTILYTSWHHVLSSSVLNVFGLLEIMMWHLYNNGKRALISANQIKCIAPRKPIYLSTNHSEYVHFIHDTWRIPVQSELFLKQSAHSFNKRNQLYTYIVLTKQPLKPELISWDLTSMGVPIRDSDLAII